MRTMIAATLLLCAAAAQSPAQSSTIKPDLHAGGAKPSTIPNHETTLVTLPGVHLTGSTVTVSGVCTLKSYKIVGDTQIAMMIEGNRQIPDKEDGCFLKVSHGAASASTYVVVDLTHAEWDQKTTQDRAANKAKGEAFLARSGKQWTIHYADGSSETYTVQPADPGQLPDFKTASGATIKIAVTDDNSVMVVAEGCMRSGTLLSGQVKDGKSMGNCKPAGSWTAQVK
jgi:hypothetical protein